MTKSKTKAKSDSKDNLPDPKEGEIVDAPAVPDKPESSLEPKPPVEREAVLSIVGGVTTEELKQALTVQTEQRKLIQEFIKENLVEGTDYGKIHVVKSCQQEERQRGSCEKDYHYSKSILFKPGQEKIFSLFGITDELIKDEDAYEMLENVPGLVAYKCIMHRGDKRIGEGRGAATLSGSQSDPNSTIKKAEKRARMDACLSLGFSAYFTQDLDDPEYAAQREMMNSKAAAEADRRDRDEFGLVPRDPDLPIDNSERAVLHRLILKAGFSDPDEILELLKSNGIADPQTMTSGESRTMMGKLSHSMFSTPTRPEKPSDEVIEDIPDREIGPDDLPDMDQTPEEPELVVDDDLKNYIANHVNSMGLTARGNMWLYKKICGRPFAKWDKMDDEEWRRAYDIVQGIIDGTYEVPDEYVAGFIENVDTPVDPSEPSNQDSNDIEQIQAAFPGAEDITKSKEVSANG